MYIYIYIYLYLYLCRFPKMGDPEVTIAFNTKSWSNDLDDLGIPMTLAARFFFRAATI